MRIYFSKILKLFFFSIWLIFFFLLFTDENLKLILLSFESKNPYLASMIFIFLQMLLSSLILPCSPITVIAGVIWGLKFGLLLSITSTIISSICTYFLGKYFLKQIVKDKDYFGIWKKIQSLIHKFDWKASFIAHCNPLFPGSSLGYIFGASKITFFSFVIGASLGTIPLQIIGILIGDKLF